MGIILALLVQRQCALLSLGGDGARPPRHAVAPDLPALTIGIHISPTLVRALRSSLIEVLGSDYVTTRVAMGLRQRPDRQLRLAQRPAAVRLDRSG